MATKYISSRFGSSLNNGDSANFPYKTLAQGGANTLNIYPGVYAELIGNNLSIIGMGRTPFETILNGYMLSGTINSVMVSLSNIHIYGYEITFKYNVGSAVNCIISNNSCIIFLSTYLNRCLFFDNAKNASNEMSCYTLQESTFYNSQLKISGNAVYKYNIFADFDLEISGTVDLRYSLFYGNCRIKKTGDAAWTSVTQFSNLTGINAGNFTGCQVFADVSATVTNNGTGKIRITKAAHGKQTGDLITIRTSTNYKTPQVAITRIDANTFDINTIAYVADENITYNVPLFTNEFKKIFHVLPRTIATKMNYETPTVPIGAMGIGIEFPNANFAGGLTNMTLAADKLSLTATTAKGIAVGQSTLQLDAGKQYKLFRLYDYQTREYENGRVLDNSDDKTTTTYAAGETVPTGYYLVENGKATISSVDYPVNEKLYQSASFTFTTNDGAILRKIPDAEWNGAKFTISCKIKKNNTWSPTIKLILGKNPNKINYVGNNPANAVEYGDGDDNFRSANAFDIYLTDIDITELVIQNNAIKA